MAPENEPSTAPAVVTGVVEDGEGRPIGGAWAGLGAAGHGLVVGADGAFRLAPSSRLESVADDLLVRLHGREIRISVADAAGGRIRVVFAPPDALPLRVLTPGSAPVPKRFAWLAFRRGPEGLTETGAGDATLARFIVRGLTPGTYGFVVWAGPFLPAVVEPVTLDGIHTLPLVTVELTRRGAAVAGRVLEKTGAARPDATVLARRDDERLKIPARRLTSRTDAGGRYRIEGLPAGRYVLTVDGAAAEVAVTLAEREERALDVIV